MWFLEKSDWWDVREVFMPGNVWEDCLNGLLSSNFVNSDTRDVLSTRDIVTVFLMRDKSPSCFFWQYVVSGPLLRYKDLITISVRVRRIEINVYLYPTPHPPPCSSLDYSCTGERLTSVSREIHLQRFTQNKLVKVPEPNVKVTSLGFIVTWFLWQ